MSLEEHERPIGINALHPGEPVFPVCVHATVQGLDGEYDGCFGLTLEEVRDFANELLAGVAELERERPGALPAT